MLLYLIELVDWLTHGSLEDNGIRPLETDGLKGILFAPLLHDDLGSPVGQHHSGIGARIPRHARGTGALRLGDGDHLGPRRPGHLADRQHRQLRHIETNHIGASGLIFGWLTFLLVFGWLTRHVWQIITSLAVLFVYGGVLLGVVPVLDRCGRVSWQGRLWRDRRRVRRLLAVRPGRGRQKRKTGITA